MNLTGNLYISDSDTMGGISWLFLQALGRNTTGQANVNTNDDFVDADILLNTTSFTDSVNFSLTSGGSPIAASTFDIYGSSMGGNDSLG